MVLMEFRYAVAEVLFEVFFVGFIYIFFFSFLFFTLLRKMFLVVYNESL